MPRHSLSAVRNSSKKELCRGAGEEVFHHQSSFLSDKGATWGLVLYSRLIFSAAFSVMAERNNGISPGNTGDRGMPIMDWYDVGRLTYVSSIAGRPQVAGRHQARSSEGPILCRQAALSRHFTYPSRPGPSWFQAEQARFTKKAKQAKPTGPQLHSQNYDQVSELVRWSLFHDLRAKFFTSYLHGK